MCMGRWQASVLDKLYNNEGKTLSEIGYIYGVTRERIRQVMARLEIPYRRKLTSKQPLHFSNLDDYLENHKGQESNETLRRYMLLDNCCLCGGSRNLFVHHKHYPARGKNDIAVLCASCHKIEHTGRIKKIERYEIYEKYLNGQTAKSLALDYNVKPVTIRKILVVVRLGLPVMKR